MNRIIKKIKNKGGASMIFALFAVLVAVMVAAVILTAALTAARNVKSDQKNVQTDLTLNSAAQLIMDELSAIQAKVNIKEIKDQGTVSGVTYTANESDITANGSPSFLSSEICAAFTGISYTNYTPVEEYTAKFEIESENMDTVNAVFIMKNGSHAQEDSTEDYEIIISLTDGNSNMYITAYVASVVSVTGDVTISWIPSISSAGN